MDPQPEVIPESNSVVDTLLGLAGKALDKLSTPGWVLACVETGRALAVDHPELIGVIPETVRQVASKIPNLETTCLVAGGVLLTHGLVRTVQAGVEFVRGSKRQASTHFVDSAIPGILSGGTLVAMPLIF